MFLKLDAQTGDIDETGIPHTAGQSDVSDWVLPVTAVDGTLYVKEYNPPAISAISLAEMSSEWSKEFGGSERPEDTLTGIAADQDRAYAGYVTSVSAIDTNTGSDEWFTIPSLNDVDDKIQTAFVAGGDETAKIENSAPLKAERVRMRALVDTPAVANGYVYAVRGGSYKDPSQGGTVTALTPNSGKTAWESTCQGDVKAASVTDDAIYVGTYAEDDMDADLSGKFTNHVQSFDADTGEENWTLPVDAVADIAVTDAGVHIIVGGVGANKEQLLTVSHTAERQSIAAEGGSTKSDTNEAETDRTAEIIGIAGAIIAAGAFAGSGITGSLLVTAIGAVVALVVGYIIAPFLYYLVTSDE